MRTIEEYAAYAEQNGYTLGDHAASIIKMVNRNEGRCPCKKGQDDQICPCPPHKEEIETNGQCTCSLFFKK